MPVHVAEHPLIEHKIGLMREKNISTKDFRDLSSEVSRLLTYEATKDLETQSKTIEGWAGLVEVREIKGKKIKLRIPAIYDIGKLCRKIFLELKLNFSLNDNALNIKFFKE